MLTFHRRGNVKKSTNRCSKQFGLEILIGHSNKSFLKNILNDEYMDLRNEGTKAISSYLILKKINYIRVHDIRSHSAILRFFRSIF